MPDPTEAHVAIERVWNAALDASNSPDFRLKDGTLDEERVLRFQGNVIAKALKAAVAEGRRQAAEAIRAGLEAGTPIPAWARLGRIPTARGLQEWAARIAEGTDDHA